jgi:hypothetical protein
MLWWRYFEKAKAAREAKGREEADEARWTRGYSARGVLGGIESRWGRRRGLVFCGELNSKADGGFEASHFEQRWRTRYRSDEVPDNSGN